MEFKGENGEFFLLSTITKETISEVTQDQESYLSIFWNAKSSSTLIIDNVSYELKPNQILFLTKKM